MGYIYEIPKFPLLIVNLLPNLDALYQLFNISSFLLENKVLFPCRQIK